MCCQLSFLAELFFITYSCVAPVGCFDGVYCFSEQRDTCNSAFELKPIDETRRESNETLSLSTASVNIIVHHYDSYKQLHVVTVYMDFTSTDTRLAAVSRAV